MFHPDGCTPIGSRLIPVAEGPSAVSCLLDIIETMRTVFCLGCVIFTISDLLLDRRRGNWLR